MRWIVTGGCGFIGTSLIRNLVEEGGHTIRVIDNFCAGTRNDLSAVCGFTEIGSGDMKPMDRMPAGKVELIDGDVIDGPLAFKACAGADAVVHLAANTGVGPSVEDPALDCTVNVFGTLNMLEAARHNHVGRFVFASSGAPIGECDPPIHEELAPHPVSPYGASKLAGEGYCSAYFRSFGLETVALRFGNVYGPGSGHKSSVVAKFIRKAMAGETLEVFGDGRQTRDFIFIEDLVRAVRRAATVSDIGGEIFQIATSAETTVGELVERLIPALAEAGIGPVELRHTTPRVGDVQRNFSDTSKARRVLDWQAEMRLNDGLRRTVEWFVHQAGRPSLSATG
jgi:UDP-glucose 4-epimerase